MSLLTTAWHGIGIQDAPMRGVRLSSNLIRDRAQKSNILLRIGCHLW